MSIGLVQTKPAGAISTLQSSLESENRAHPYASKRLIGPDVNYGRELLVALARRTGGWIGWEATNLRRIAGDLAFVPLHAACVRVGGDVEIRVLVNRALDRAMERATVSSDFAALGRNLGFRQALRDSVLELRVAGIGPQALHNATIEDSPARGVAAVLNEYEAVLRDNGVTDSAGVFRAALDNFDAQARYCLTGELLLAPILVERGLPGELLERLISFGARLLDGDTGIGTRTPRHSALFRTATVERSPAAPRASGTMLAWITSPTLPTAADVMLDAQLATAEMFVAASPADELREVFRCVTAEGIRWDDVEIVATDVDTYGVALDVLCQRLGVGGTMLSGVPLARTRLGRTLERWFAWLDNGLPADLLRQALEAGEIGADIDAEPAALARELRELRIGWGRERYESAVRLLESFGADTRIRPYEDEPDDDYRARVASRRRSAAALHSLLVAVLNATPRVPERGSHVVVTSSVSALAAATLRWLALVKLHGAAELQTVERVRVRLQSLAELDGATTTFGIALATLRDALGDVRAWPLLTSDTKPWSAAGGLVHLTDVAHAGTTGRSRIFVVGLDSDATSGSSRQDPLIPDAVRTAIQDNALSTTVQRREDRAYRLGVALASLRGRVTLSYATTRSLDSGEAGPAAELLQLYRVREGNGNLAYADLRKRLGSPASAVPARVSPLGIGGLLDARDVWLDALADGPILLNGEALVRECFRSLDSGKKARDAARGPTLTQYTGLVPGAAALDPRNWSDRAISASALEKLAACPLSWFYHYGLGLRAPEDPEYDPGTWLDSAQRGALLHELFDEFATQFRDRRGELESSIATDTMTSITEQIIARWKADVPPPGDVVLEGEIDELKRAAASFLEMERSALKAGDGATWRYLEYAFGADGASARYSLTDGSSLAIKGRVDRIDEMSDGSFNVIDYKTGSAGRYRKTSKRGKFNGGRQLQPAIYSGVLDQLLNGTVARFEYRFPTERGQNQVVAYAAAELAEARPVVTQLLEYVRDGAFIVTTDANDCKYCNARQICRVSNDRYGKPTSPRANWARENADTIDAYRGMLERRTGQASA